MRITELWIGAGRLLKRPSVLRSDLTENDFFNPHPDLLLQVFDHLKPAYSTAAL